MKKVQFVKEFDVCPELKPIIYTKFKGPRNADSKVSDYTCKRLDKKGGDVCIRYEGDFGGRCIIAKIKEKEK